MSQPCGVPGSASSLHWAALWAAVPERGQVFLSGLAASQTSCAGTVRRSSGGAADLPPAMKQSGGTRRVGLPKGRLPLVSFLLPLLLHLHLLLCAHFYTVRVYWSTPASCTY